MEHVNINNTNSYLKTNTTKPIAILDNTFLLTQKIGKGSTASVYIGHSNVSSKMYSFKIINPSNIDVHLIEREVQMLNLVSHHNNVLQIYHSGYGTLIKSSGKTRQVYYLVLEYLEHGELLDYIYITKGFGEEYARLIFHDLLNAVESIHNSGVVHRDIKADNVMIASDYSIKLVDFGFATLKSQGKLSSFLGTPNYAAPELHMKKPYNGVTNDIFALGVTIFVIITGTLPFKYPVESDSLYKYIIMNDYQTYWIQRNVRMSQSFMELFNNMIAFDYTQRPSIDEIRKSRWMSEIDFSLLPMLKEELKTRVNLVKAKKEERLNKMRLIEKRDKERRKIYQQQCDTKEYS